MNISSNPSSIYIVIAAYNEATVIGNTIKPLLEKGYCIVVVDDGSTDETGRILGNYPIHYLRHVINLGQGAALLTGTLYAIQEKAAFVVHFDADGQHDPDDIPGLIEPLVMEQASVVLGSRFLRSKDKFLVPLPVRLVLKAATIVNGLLTGLWCSDAHNGMRAFTQEAARQLQWRENRHAHASEILTLIRRAGLIWTERPTKIIYTLYSREKGQKLWNSLNILFDLITGKIFR